MATRTVIDPKYTSTKLPIFGTILAVLALDYWNAPGWLIGVVGTIMVVLWITAIVLVIQQKFVHPDDLEKR